MGLTKVLAGVTGAVIAVAGVAAIAVHSGGGTGTPEKPVVSARSSVSSTVVAPVAAGGNPGAGSGVSAAAGAQAGSATQSPASTVPPAAQASPAVPVPTAGAAGATSVPSAQDVLNSVTALMNQLTQSTSANGQPQPLTPEQVNAAINDQLAKLGIKH